MKAIGLSLVIAVCYPYFICAQQVIDTLALQRLKEKSSAFSEAGLYDSVVVCQEELKAIYKNRRQWREVIDCQLEIISGQIQQSAHNAAIISLDEGSNLVKEFLPGDVHSLAELNNLYGVLYFQLGDYEKAVTHLKQSLSYQLKKNTLSDQQDLATKYNNLAAITSRMGDYDEAIYYYNKSLDIRMRQPDLMAVGESYNNLSVSYYRKKMFNEALAYGKRYLEILDKFKDKTLTTDYILCYNSIGIYYFELKEYQKALDYLNKALALNRTNDSFIEKTYHNLGYVYRMMEQDEKALKYLQLALDRNCKKYKNGHPDIGKEYRHLGVIYLRITGPQKGLSYFQKALTYLVDNFSDSTGMTNPPLTSIRSKPDLLRTLRDKASALRMLSIIKNDSSLLTISLKTSRMAIRLIEQMREEYEAQDARRFINEEALPVYAGALETIQAINNSSSDTLNALAFEIMEKSHALLLMESLQRKEQAPSYGVPDSLLEREQKLRTRIAFYERQLNLVTTRKDSVAIVKTTQYLQVNQDKFRLLSDIFKHRFPRYYSGRNQLSIVPLNEIKLFLKKKQTSMVEYFLSESKLWTLVVTPHQSVLIEKEKPPEFELWIAAYEKSLRNYTFITDSAEHCYNLFSNSAYKIYQYLLADAMEIINKTNTKALLIVPHDKLSYLPFESLLVNKAPTDFGGYSNLDYLIKTIPVSYAYSGSSHLALHQSEETYSMECLAFGPGFIKSKRAGETLSLLPNIKNELKAIQNIFDGRFFYDNEATKKQFRESSTHYGIIHLATHSIVDELDPANSRIHFSAVFDKPDDNILYSYEIANLSLHASLVVLSSCETGAGKLARGEGVMSMGRSFIYAGANSVLMNLWQAEDHANASIIAAFYEELGNGSSKLKSLHNAKLKYIKETDEFMAHPAFWAGYVLIGNEDAISQNNYRWMVTLFVMLTGVVMLYLILNRLRK